MDVGNCSALMLLFGFVGFWGDIFFFFESTPFPRREPWAMRPFF